MGGIRASFTEAPASASPVCVVTVPRIVAFETLLEFREGSCASKSEGKRRETSKTSHGTSDCLGTSDKQLLVRKGFASHVLLGDWFILIVHTTLNHNLR